MSEQIAGWVVAALALYTAAGVVRAGDQLILYADPATYRLAGR